MDAQSDHACSAQSMRLRDLVRKQLKVNETDTALQHHTPDAN